MGSNADGTPVIEIHGLVNDTINGISVGSAYALRDALSAALEDYEIDLDNRKHKDAPPGAEARLK